LQSLPEGGQVIERYRLAGKLVNERSGTIVLGSQFG
jgi:hypothetical protein